MPALRAIRAGLAGLYLVAIALLAALPGAAAEPPKAAANEKATVEVSCGSTDDGSGLACVLTRLSGALKNRACWDVKVTCRNGIVSTAHTCDDVPGEPGSSSRHVVPASEFSDDCDKARTAEIENLVVE